MVTKLQGFKTFLRSLLPRKIGPQHIIGGPLRGSIIVTSWHDYPAAILGYTERPLLGWFAHHVRRGETWLDIGSHYGYTALALSRLVGSEGRVFAFEPMVSTAGCVAQTRLLNQMSQLTVVPMALAELPGEMTIQRLPTTRGMADSTLSVDGKWSELLYVTSLDWLWSRICGGQKQVDGIKIDVQGMELDVLRGGCEILRQWTPRLIVEVHAGVDRVELLRLLASVGYGGEGVPVDPEPGGHSPQYLDNHSYAFFPS